MDTRTRAIVGDIAKEVLHQVVVEHMKQLGLNWNTCIMGCLIEETGFFGFDNSNVPCYVKTSTPLMPNMDVFPILLIPHKAWIVGLMHLRLTPTSHNAVAFLRGASVPWFMAEFVNKSPLKKEGGKNDNKREKNDNEEETTKKDVPKDVSKEFTEDSIDNSNKEKVRKDEVKKCEACKEKGPLNSKRVVSKEETLTANNSARDASPQEMQANLA